MERRRIGACWIGSILGLAVAACATTHVRTDHDPRANFAGYRTFAVKEGQVVNNGVVDPHDTLVRDRINAALRQELAHKGLQSAQNPDLIVTYTAGARSRREVEAVWADQDIGWYPVPTYGNDVWVEMEPESTLVIDVIDARTNKLVWRSVAEADNKDFRSAKNIRKAVDKALENYPEARVG